WPGEAGDQARANRINDIREDDRNGPTRLLQRPHNRCRRGQDHIRRKRNQFHCVFAYAVGFNIACAPAILDSLESRGLTLYGCDACSRRLIGVKIDVTERKKAEALIKESKTRLADALTAGEVIAFDCDAVTGLAQRSDNATDILGSQDRWEGLCATIRGLCT